MHIRQLSAALDAKLAQLDHQLKALEAQHQQTGGVTDPQVTRDIAALQQIRDKLLKSKDIAWRAHQLRDNEDEQRRARQRAMGLILCGMSLLGGVLLLYLTLQ